MLEFSQAGLVTASIFVYTRVHIYMVCVCVRVISRLIQLFHLSSLIGCMLL